MIKEILDSFKQKEKCVVCGVKTKVSEDTHINNRNNYIECAGQLCSKCYCFIFSAKKES